MTIEQLRTLGEVIREGLAALPGAPIRDIVNWVREHYRYVIEENFETISYQGLTMMIRAARKDKPLPPVEIRPYCESLCLDFGLPPIALDREISVPRDMECLANSVCDWPDIEDTTIRDFDKHILLLRTTGRSILAHAEHCEMLRQAAMKHNPDGSLDRTIGELRKLARERGN